MISKRKAFIISAIVFLIPVIIFVVIISFGMKQVALMGTDQRLAKTYNYTTLSKTAPLHANVFFGDSITELCPLEEIYADYIKETGIPIINRGISSETTSTMLERLEDNVVSIQPRNLVMLMGINDLPENISLEKIVSNIQQMIQITKSKSPSTHIVLQAVYPINKSNRNSYYEKVQIGNRDNHTIKELNQLLNQLAEDENITFLDVTQYLVDNQGELKKDYTYDGLHPNTKGYMAVKDNIIKALK